MAKFESAVREYGRAQREIKRLSSALCDARAACYNAQEAEHQKLHGKQTFDELYPELVFVDHLKTAYEFLRDDDGVGYHVTEEEPGAYLARTCPHCLAAHNLIQERKEAKQRFGVAKRRISFLGRAG